MTYRFNVSHHNADATLQKTLDEIRDEYLADGALGPRSVEDALRTAARSAMRSPLSMELVAHAADGVIAIGDWIVDDQSPATSDLKAQCQAELPQLRAGQILLLGCNTAVTKAGQDAILHVAKVFRTKVAGSTVPLYSRHFGNCGLLATGVLAYQDELPPVADPSKNMAARFAEFDQKPGLGLSEVLGDLQGETFEEATRAWQLSSRKWPLRKLANTHELQSCFEFIDPRFAAAPGLLALPEREYLLPADDSGMLFHRLTILISGYLARVYPQGQPDGLVLHATQPLLVTCPPGTPI